MTFVHQVLVQTLTATHLHDRALGGDPFSTSSAVAQVTSSAPTATPTMSNNQSNGGTSSPLLFFVALGFGVVFTNLWIIVGVKYCFRYNARNRAIRNGEDPDPIGLDAMPTRPHRRRREKKLMTMEEVNERFPLTKYKNWVISRASEGLPTAGGVSAPSSRPGSVRDLDGVLPPSSPVETKHSVETRPTTAVSREANIADAAMTTKDGSKIAEKKDTAEERNTLQQVQTTTSTVDKHATRTSEDDDDEDDHIHTAVPPELLTNPGDSCAICIDTLEDEDDIRGLTCGHAFHASCLDPWLTSRRACCPLCKADYFVPKPRPEGEAAESDRTGRRGNRTPAVPAAVWTGGLRRGLVIPGRFANAGYPEAGDNSRAARRARRVTTQASPAANADGTSAEGTTNPPVNTSRWRPRMTNPFSNIHMPNIPGRNRQQASHQTNAEPSPSQLEAGRAPGS